MHAHEIVDSRPLGTVLVSGGTSGLGAAVCAAIAGRGGTPVVIDLDPPPVGSFEKVDLTDTAATEAAVRRLADDHGGLDAVVTCAGIDVPGAFGATPSSTWERIVAVNLFGTAAVARAALPWLEERGGRIVTVASTLGHRVAGDASAYCASKFGVVGFTRALMAELAGRVGVTLLVPGGMSTPFFDGRDERYRPGPDAQLCDPARIAGVVVFALCQPPGAELKEVVVAAERESSWP